MDYLDDAVLVLCFGIVYFLIFCLPGVLSTKQNIKLKLEQERTKQAEFNAAGEASKLEAKRLETRQFNGYQK